MSTTANKARMFLRRGSDETRLQTTLCEGELGYSTDGARVFVGDDSTVGGISVGSKVWMLEAGSDVTTLTAASATGRAEVGDLAWVPSSSFDVSAVNADAPSSTITPAADTGLLYALSARNGNDLTWVLANSGVPVSQIDFADNSINGDKIHGGDISGDVTFSGTVSAVSVTTTTSKVHDLSGTGSRPVFASSAGVLETGGSNIITSTEYFDKYQLTTALQVKDNTAAGTAEPLAGDGNWDVIDLSTAIAARTTLPVTYPKVAIINVYHTEPSIFVKLRSYGIFTAHSTSSYGTSSNYYQQARFCGGEDGGKGVVHFSWGSQLFVRLNGTSNNLIIQYTVFDSNAISGDDDLTVDLIGVQY